MNPLARQELVHNRSLWREHAGVLLFILRFALLGCEAGAIVDGLAGGRGAGRIDEALRV
jgi:hypothetical protein